ncbi:VCBS repeat-containing protein [Algoriphagus halophytocola]|uniref:VCBS repeat-containing protein n=1 Tax=Algoriphagus halophytocola TaxID=2991499 RepID=A0ABY6MIY6_9BACT|nr:MULTISPECIES: VCBS repeat-containing protein [unclassified Algoriphagus]UZD22949.1 VCBS repeat-containing protein [Algoriphagus sp. TR-M5]WBL44218.1 VCBS repeat-containing protein [Algoriphagus sp. TR-M9]
MGRIVILILVLCFFSAACDTGNDDQPDDFSIGGKILGNSGEVVLRLNGNSETFGGDSFTFSDMLALGEAYQVSFISAADGQICEVSNGGGNIAGNVSDIVITCASERTDVINYDFTGITGNLSSGDFNGDGIVDLVFSIRTLDGHPQGGNLEPLRVLFGSGNGGFTAYHDLSLFGDPNSNQVGRYLAVADFDQDGIQDFAFANPTTMELFKGKAEGAPEALEHTGSYSGEPIEILDANGDGFPDILTEVAGGSVIDYFGLYLNQSGKLADPLFVGNVIDQDIKDLKIGYPLNFSIGDVDGNNTEDIIAIVQTPYPGGENGIGLVVFKGDGTGSFSNPTEIIYLNPDLFLGSQYFDEVSREIGLGDLDGDGDLDVVLMASSNFVQVLFNDGKGLFAESGKFQVGERPIHIKIIDLNNDGLLDIFTLNAESRDFSILYGRGAGQFDEAIHTFIHEDAELYDVTMNDFDGNDFIDIAVAENTSRSENIRRGAIRLFFNPGL